jgi:hypothetical protein
MTMGTPERRVNLSENLSEVAVEKFLKKLQKQKK